MNKKLLIALGILIVLVVGLVSLDCQKMAIKSIEQQFMEMSSGVFKIGENTVTLESTSATYLGYSGGYYNVRFKGVIRVYSDEPMAWKAGFDVMGSKKLITVCNPNSYKIYTYDRSVYCNTSYWWRTYAIRIDGQVGGNGSYGPSFYIPCQ